jgi:hypothetical protein
MPMSTLQQRGGFDGSGDFGGVGGADPLSFPSSSQVNMSSQMSSDNLQATLQQLDAMQDSQQQQQLPMSYNQQQLPPQQLQQPQTSVKMENGGMVVVKQEQQMGQPDHNGPSQMVHNTGGIKLEPQQLQAQMMRSLSAVKMEQSSSDSSAFLHQQQQQHLLQLTQQIRNSPDLVSMGGPSTIANPQAAAAAQLSLLQQQRLLHMQQQQQQHILKNLPLQRNQLQQQQQQQQQLLRQQSLNMRTPGKSAPYEPGTCAKRLTHYMYHQQNRPQVSFLLGGLFV